MFIETSDERIDITGIATRSYGLDQILLFGVLFAI
jgi:hypothetical protein